MTDNMLFWAQQSAAVSPVRSQRAFVHHTIKHSVALNKSFPPRRQTLQPGVRILHAKKQQQAAISLAFYFIEEINEQYKV